MGLRQLRTGVEIGARWARVSAAGMVALCVVIVTVALCIGAWIATVFGTIAIIAGTRYLKATRHSQEYGDE